MESSLRRQKGASFFGVIAIIFAIAMAGLLAVRMVPVYLEANSVRGIVNDLQDDPDLRSASGTEIRRRLERHFRVNNISGPDLEEDLSFESVPAGRQVILAYEVRFPVVGNLDGVAMFEYTSVVPNN